MNQEPFLMCAQLRYQHNEPSTLRTIAGRTSYAPSGALWAPELRCERLPQGSAGGHPRARLLEGRLLEYYEAETHPAVIKKREKQKKKTAKQRGAARGRGRAYSCSWSSTA